MVDEAKLIEGLRKADQAGDAQAVQRFTELIKQSRQSTASNTAQKQDIEGVPEFGTVDGLNALFGSQFGDDNTGTMQIVKDAAAQLFTLSPKARLDGLKKRFPELEFKEFGDNNAIIRNPSTGAINVLNGEGISNQDIAPFVGSALAFTPAGKAIQLPATVGGKVAAGALASGATDLALQKGEQLQGGEQDIDLTRAGTSAAFGGVFPAIPATAKAISEKAGVGKLLDKATPTIENLKSRASEIYKEVDNLGAKLPKSFTTRTRNSLITTLNKEVLPESQPTAIKKILKSLENREGKKITLSEFDAIRKTAGTLSKSADANERRLATIVTDKLDEAFESASSSILSKGGTVSARFKEARTLWRTAKKSEIIDDALTKAQNQASGFENGVRTQFRSIINNKRAARNFTPAEIASMQKVVRGGKAENILKAMGRFGFTEGQATQMLMGSIGVAAGSAIGGVPGAIAVPLAGQISKTLAQKLTRNNAKLTDRIVKLGNDSEEIAKAYFRAVPKNQRSAEELSELFMLRGAKLDSVRESAKKLPSSTRQILEDAALMSTGANLSSGLQ